MLPARKDIAAGLATTPAFVVISLAAAFNRGVLAAVTRLSRTRQKARRTGACMTFQWTRVRTSPSRFRTCLAATMWAYSRYRPWVDFFPAPTMIRGGLICHCRVASRTTPAIPTCVRLGLVIGFCLVRVPFLHARQMSNSPTYRTRPDLRVTKNFVGAYDAFVLAITDIFVDASRKIWCGRLRSSSHVVFSPGLFTVRLLAVKSINYRNFSNPSDRPVTYLPGGRGSPGMNTGALAFRVAFAPLPSRDSSVR